MDDGGADSGGESDDIFAGDIGGGNESFGDIGGFVEFPKEGIGSSEEASDGGFEEVLEVFAVHSEMPHSSALYQSCVLL